jgi:hypothetical protein
MARIEALTTGQLLDRVFSFYTKNFILFFTIALIPKLMYLAFLMIPILGTAGGLFTHGSTGTILATVIGAIIAFLIYFATIAVSQGATTVAVSDLYLGQPTSVGKCYRQTMPMALRLMGLAIGYGMLVGLGFMLLIVPGVYWGITYALAISVMAIERVSFSEAMSRSSDLVKGNRGRVALIYLLSFVLSMVVAFGLQVPSQLIVTALSKTHPVIGSIISLTMSSLAGALATPVGLIGFTLAYYDVRVRREAFDLEYMMQTDAATVPALAAASSSASATGQ